MTTIAYKDGIIAYDSRITRGSQITYDDYEKRIERDGVIFVLSGATADFDALVDAYFGQAPSGPIDASAVVVDGDRLQHFAVDSETGPWKAPIMKDRPYSIGSGQEYALAAMDMGADAASAILAAARRDTATGGTIRRLVLRQEACSA